MRNPERGISQAKREFEGKQPLYVVDIPGLSEWPEDLQRRSLKLSLDDLDRWPESAPILIGSKSAQEYARKRKKTAHPFVVVIVEPKEPLVIPQIPGRNPFSSVIASGGWNIIRNIYSYLPADKNPSRQDRNIPG